MNQVPFNDPIMALHFRAVKTIEEFLGSRPDNAADASDDLDENVTPCGGIVIWDYGTDICSVCGNRCYEQ